MRNYSIYHGARQSGKTRFLLEEVGVALAVGARVAIITPFYQISRSIVERSRVFTSGPVDVYTEATISRARGRTYDAVFVDNAHLFYESPVRLAREVAPGAPAVFTYTAYPFD